MNSKDAKKLRKFFAKLKEMNLGLPDMWQETPAYEFKRAGDMSYDELAKVVAALDGKQLHEDETYRLTNIIKVKINHYNRMKKYYAEHGLKGYSMYIVELRRKIEAHIERKKAGEESNISLGELQTWDYWLGFFERIKLLLKMLFNLTVDYAEYDKKKKKVA